MNATRFFSSCLLGAMIVTSASIPAYAQVKKTGDSYLLRMKFKVGETTKYQMSMSGDMVPPGMSVAMSSLVKKFSADIADIEYTATPSAGVPGGGKPSVTNVRVNSRGKMVSGASSQMGQQFGNVELPEKPVKIGQSWSANIVPTPGMNITSTYKLVGTKMVGGMECANIGVTMSSKGGQAKINGTGTILLRMSDCSLQTANINTTINASMPSQNGGAAKPMVFKQKIAITRK